MSKRYTSKKAVKPINIKKELPKVKRQPKHVDQFMRVESNVSIIEPSQQPNEDIIEAIDHLLSTRWGAILPELNQDFISHIEKFRSYVPKAICKYQMYSVLPNNETLVDQELDRLTREGLLFRTTSNDGVTEWVIEIEDFVKFIQLQITTGGDQMNGGTEGLDNYQELITSDYRKPTITKEDLKEIYGFTDIQLTSLTKSGFFEILPLEPVNVLKISIPRVANLHKVLSLAEAFIKRALHATKFKEMNIIELQTKWDMNKSKFKDYKGMTLSFALHYCIGKGLLEAFKSVGGHKVVKLIL